MDTPELANYRNLWQKVYDYLLRSLRMVELTQRSLATVRETHPKMHPEELGQVASILSSALWYAPVPRDRVDTLCELVARTCDPWGGPISL